MSKFNSWETSFLELIFKNTSPSALIGGDAGIEGSLTAGSLYIALFTANPDDDQSGVAAGECDYTGYDRVAVARDGTGWTVSGNTCTNAAAITFGTCTAGTNAVTHFGICKGSTKTNTDLLFYGTFSGSGLSVSAGVTPQIQAGDLSITEN